AKPGEGASKRRSCLVVVGWEHAGGLPRSWGRGDALRHWAVARDNGVNVAGAGAMIEGYQWEAGVLPPLDMAMFRGAVIALGNYVFDLAEDALTARDAGDQQHTARSVRHVLPQLSSRARSRANLEQLLDVALATAHSSRAGRPRGHRGRCHVAVEVPSCPWNTIAWRLPLPEHVACYRQAAAEFDRHAHAALEMLRLGTAAGFQIERSRARVIGSS